MIFLFQIQPSKISPGTFFGKKKQSNRQELKRDEKTDERIQEIWGEELRRREALAKGLSLEMYVKQQKEITKREFENDVLEIIDNN